MELNTFTFTAPSGKQYTIREQNGQDEEILTNVGEANRFMNINNFLQGIIMNTSFKEGKLSMQEVLDIPYLDRQCILIQSRIFSLGEIMEFTYKWPAPDGKTQEFEYEQDLNEFLFDYSNPEGISEATLLEKPHAIPFYPEGVEDYFYVSLPSGRSARFKPFNGESEIYVMKLSENARTRNSDMIARHLELEVDGKWERVFNFSLFSMKDMRELRKNINTFDPTPNTLTTINNPDTGEVQEINIMALPYFFFPEEDV